MGGGADRDCFLLSTTQLARAVPPPPAVLCARHPPEQSAESAPRAKGAQCRPGGRQPPPAGLATQMKVTSPSKNSPDPPSSPQPAATKPQAAIAKAAAVFAATVLIATPAFAVDKAAICARTPTAKICLRDSAKN